MQEANLYNLFLAPLNAAGVDYMVTGSVACIIYGQPRMTHDIDLVLNINISFLDEFTELFSQDSFYCPPVDVIKMECLRQTRGHFNLIHHQSGFKADIYSVGRDELMKWGLTHKKQYDMQGQIVWVAPPEYVIVQKLQFFREGHSPKHLTDIRGIQNTSGAMIDNDWLRQWIEDHGLQAEWDQVNETDR